MIWNTLYIRNVRKKKSKTIDCYYKFNRDFSRFSEDRPTPHVVDFWPVTSVCLLLRIVWLADELDGACAIHSGHSYAVGSCSNTQ